MSSVGGGGVAAGFWSLFFGPNGGLYKLWSGLSGGGGDGSGSFRRGGLFALDVGGGWEERGGGGVVSPFLTAPKIAFDAPLSHLFISKLRATSWSFSSSSSSSSSTTDSSFLLSDFTGDARTKIRL